MSSLCCPFCGGPLSVYKTISGKTQIRRIRHCEQCHQDSETVEAFAKPVTKRRGKRPPTDSLSGMTTLPDALLVNPRSSGSIPEKL